MFSAVAINLFYFFAVNQFIFPLSFVCVCVYENVAIGRPPPGSQQSLRMVERTK